MAAPGDDDAITATMRGVRERDGWDTIAVVAILLIVDDAAPASLPRVTWSLGHLMRRPLGEDIDAVLVAVLRGGEEGCLAEAEEEQEEERQDQRELDEGLAIMPDTRNG